MSNFHKITFKDLDRVLAQAETLSGDFCTSFVVWSDEHLREDLKKLARKERIPEIIPNDDKNSMFAYCGIPVFVNPHFPTHQVVATTAHGGIVVIDLETSW